MDGALLNTLGKDRSVKVPVLLKGRAAASFATIKMRYKRKTVLLCIVILLLVAVQYALPRYAGVQQFYASYIFRPWQSLRNMAFGSFSLSVGDLLYILGAFVLIAVVVRWLYFLVRIRTHKHYLGTSLLNTVTTLTIIYLLFVAGWGGNYYKPSLAKHWGLVVEKDGDDSAVLATYDRFLITRLNDLAPSYKPLSFRTVNHSAIAFYKRLTNSPTRLHGLNSKPSVFGYFMQYLGIQGYYNPFTGEAQVNRFLPPYMLPFVVCHEMAHQSGIAAEDDANLLAYALCTSSADSSFEYSGYFNLWLYTHSRLKGVDTTVANDFYATLNQVSRSQVDTLRAIRRRYRSDVSEYSSEIYDSYLRLHDQKDGIESYSKAALTAWAWENQKRRLAAIITLP